jgi:hypothetical protein
MNIENMNNCKKIIQTQLNEQHSRLANHRSAINNIETEMYETAKKMTECNKTIQSATEGGHKRSTKCVKSNRRRNRSLRYRSRAKYHKKTARR